MGVELVDVYYQRRLNPSVPVEESRGAMEAHVAEGKVRDLDISEQSVGDLERVLPIHPVTAVQSELSLWTRDYLHDVVPWCAANGTFPGSGSGRLRRPTGSASSTGEASNR